MYFADLRPDYVETVRDDGGIERTFVALAILEYPSVQWEMDEDQVTGLVEEVTTLSRGERAPAEKLTMVGLGEGTAFLAYCVVELDSDGGALDEWHPGGLEACKAFLDSYEGAAWERLPSEREGAALHVRRRLAQPPGRP